MPNQFLYKLIITGAHGLRDHGRNTDAQCDDYTVQQKDR